MELRSRNSAFAGLAKGPWALFIAIAVHWQGHAEAWPSQEALARFSGWSSRAVRNHADTLERGGFVRLRRERRPDGSERIFYAPGLVTLAALAAFVERFPRERFEDRPKPVEVAAPPSPPETVSPAPPEGASMEHRDLKIKPSSCEESITHDVASPEEEQIGPSDLDREVAREALRDRIRRKHPTRTSPTWFDKEDLAMVAVCSALIDGDREVKLLAHQHALDGAFTASKDGPPTSRFVWGKPEHFLDHVERGRRRAAARAAPVAHIQSAPTRAALGVGVSAEKMAADLAWLFQGRPSS